MNINEDSGNHHRIMGLEVINHASISHMEEQVSTAKIARVYDTYYFESTELQWARAPKRMPRTTSSSPFVARVLPSMSGKGLAPLEDVVDGAVPVGLCSVGQDNTSSR